MAHTLRLLTFNIHKGYSTGKIRYTLKKIYQALRSVEIDIVFLQEVMGKEKSGNSTSEMKTQAQFEFLADTLWPHFAYGQNAVFKESHHGNAILSRYPIKWHNNINLSTNRLEKRGLLHAIIAIPGVKDPLHCFNVHLNLFERGRQNQLPGLVNYFHKEVSAKYPFILAGDFNDWTQRLSKQLEKKIEVKELFNSCHGKHAKTFPSHLPILKLDRIYGRGVKAVKAQVLKGKEWRSLSDHAPILVEVTL